MSIQDEDSAFDLLEIEQVVLFLKSKGCFVVEHQAETGYPRSVRRRPYWTIYDKRMCIVGQILYDRPDRAKEDIRRNLHKLGLYKEYYESINK